MSLRRTTRPFYFWNCGSNSEFWRWQRSINDAKRTFLPHSLRRQSLHFCFWLSSAAMPVFSHFSQYFSTAAFASGIFMAPGTGINLCTRLWWPNESTPFPAMWSSWYLWGAPSIRILIDSSASTIQAYFVLCFPILRQVSLLLWHGGGYKALQLASEFPNFLRAFFIMRLNSSSSGSLK